MALSQKGIWTRVETHPFPVFEARFATLVAGHEEDLAVYDPADGVVPLAVTSTTVIPPTSNDPVYFSWIKDDTDTTNNEVRVKWDTRAGGDLTGAEVILHVKYPAHSGGGITA